MEITIIKALEEIRNKKWLLPDFQRDFVWDKKRITNLWDSILRDYPMNSLLLWEIKEDTSETKICDFYEFNSEIKLKETAISTPCPDTLKDKCAVLDGQQRLTSLLVGLFGSIIEGKKNRHYHLYLRLDDDVDDNKIKAERDYADSDDEIYSAKYNFQFLPELDTQKKDVHKDKDENVWFRVGKVTDFKNDIDFQKYLSRENLPASFIVSRLWNAVHKNYDIIYDKKDNKEDAITMFLRINCGVKPLTPADIILSMITVNWKEAKKEIKTIVADANDNGISIKFDFIVKCMLALFGKNVKYHPNNINKSFVKKIETKWYDIANCFDILKNLFVGFGLSNKKIPSNALVPIFCYLYYNKKDLANLTQDDKETIHHWLLKTIILKLFSGQSDNVITYSIKPFDKGKVSHNCFPAAEISKEIEPYRQQFEIEDKLDELKYGESDTYIVLSLLQLDGFEFAKPHDIDHLHPKVNIKHQLLSKEQCNSIVNLHLLEKEENGKNGKGDSPLMEWIAGLDSERQSKIKENSLIPNVSLDIKDYDKFYQERKKMMVEKLQQQLQKN